MASMFEGFNKDLRKKLTSLYEQFIENPESQSIRENAATIAQRYAISGKQISPESNDALGKAYDLELGKLSVDEAKKILEELLKKE